MKIVFTGGGTGGHFYPIIAVAQELNTKLQTDKETASTTDASGQDEAHRMYFIAPDAHDEKMLESAGLEYIRIPSGKMRRYFSLQNILDIFKVIGGTIKATWILFTLYPDVVFAKGAYGSVPVLWAARILRIPVMIHESDSVPGRANAWAGKFATRIAVSYKEAAAHFPKDKVAYTGQPIRTDIQEPIKEGSRDHFHITEPDVPVLLVLGGSQGAQNVNSAILNALPQLVNEFVVIHQAGDGNLGDTSEVARTVLYDHEFAHRYIVRGSLNNTDMARAAGIASLVISRAGSTIFEIARWGIPSIIIPITDSNGDHQRTNAFAYARVGAASVIEEANLTTNILLSEIHRILGQEEVYADMSKSTAAFVHPDAAKIIADELYRIAETHNA